MKAEIILGLVLMNLTIGDKQKRSTVLTDESKRILEHFDFSNFDKQEALNYLDRQRYDNQIRGKRNQCRYRSYSEKRKGNDVINEENESRRYENNLKSDTKIRHENTNENPTYAITNGVNCECPEEPDVSHPFLENVKIRSKRGHHRKKKHRVKQGPSKEDSFNYDEDYDEKRFRKRKKKRKKKRHYWNTWSEWSPCSVTCGRGRKIRWRKCIAKNCTTGELEMGEKTCQLPACNLLTKILGL